MSQDYMQEIDRAQQDTYPPPADREQDYYCAHCRQRPKDTTESPYSALCADCRSQMTRLRVPAWVVAFMAGLLVLFGVMLLQLPQSMEHYRQFVQAEKQMKANEYLFAFENYMNILESYDSSTKVALQAAEAAMGAQLFDYAGYVIDTYLVEKEVNDNQYDRAMYMIGKLDRYYNAQYELSQYLEQTANVEGMDQEAFLAPIKQLLDDPQNDKTLIYYYLGNMAPTIEESLDYLERASRQDAELTYPLAVYGNVLRRAQRFEEAEAVYREAVGKNACDSSAIIGLGVLELLNGDKAQGLSMIEQAYEMTPFTSFVPEALVIALCENGQREAALAVLAEKQAEEYPFDTEIQDYLDGRVTLQSYYIG